TTRDGAATASAGASTAAPPRPSPRCGRCPSTSARAGRARRSRRSQPCCPEAVPLALLVAALVPALLAADTVVLKDGRTLEVDRAWFEGTEVRYRKGGETFGLPRDKVERIDSPTGEGGL